MLTVQPQVPLQLSLPVTVTSQMMAQIQRWLLAPTEACVFLFRSHILEKTENTLWHYL